MNALIRAFIVLILTAGVAYAGWNIKQEDDGRTVWQNQDEVTISVAHPGLMITVTNFAVQATWVTISHVPGRISKVYAIINDSFSEFADSPVLSLWLRDITDVDGLFTQVSSSGSAAGTITLPTAAAATSSSVTFDDPGTSRDVAQGQAIAIRTNASVTSASAVSGVVIIVIE